jgi:plasmid stabilization system protein ParE
MSFDVVVGAAATADIASAVDYYCQFDKREAFFEALDRVFEQLAAHPLTYPLVHGMFVGPCCGAFRFRSSSFSRPHALSFSPFIISAETQLLDLSRQTTVHDLA